MNSIGKTKAKAFQVFLVLVGKNNRIRVLLSSENPSKIFLLYIVYICTYICAYIYTHTKHQKTITIYA